MRIKLWQLAIISLIAALAGGFVVISGAVYSVNKIVDNLVLPINED